VCDKVAKRAGVRRLHLLYADSTRIARDAALNRVLATLETDLHRIHREATSDMTFLHAEVVGWQEVDRIPRSQPSVARQH